MASVANDLLLFLILSFATYRVARFIAQDSFPPMEQLRNKILYRDEEVDPRNKWVVGLECPHCVGPYVAIIIVVIVNAMVGVPLPVIYALAVAGLQSAFASLVAEE